MTDSGHVRPSWGQYRPAQRWGYLFILFLVCLSNYIDRQVMSVLLEPIKQEFEASDTQMGLLTGFAFAATYAVLGIPIARWADRGDRRIVITVSLAVWSAATVACGFAKTFPILVLTRLGVGVGEAGAIPPAQSLIADYFAPSQRARALSLFMSASAFGYLAAFVGGTYIAAEYGWRWAFIALGAPGLLLCLTAMFGLSEPRAYLERMEQVASESLMTALRLLARKRSYVLINVSMVLYFLVAYGAVTWLPAYLQRVLELDLVKIGAMFGIASMGATLVGTLVGGWVTDWVGKKDSGALARVPGIALIAVAPIYQLMMWTDDIRAFIFLSFVGGLGLGAAIPAMFAALHVVCGSARRSVAVAIAFFFSNLLGLGFGPLITGALSDMFTAAYGPVGLRYALMIAFAMLVPTGVVLCWAALSLEHDAEA
jgi:MFS family permease